ncbi:uncharacterized protein RCC_03034 [Ramularia collo-cygni]|uniref:DUF1754-domain-containing protein n=1 Tax=Ramularia collo-cygni TaxID=112498 RepID=A0A2D3UN24_9PEZI|nr:uncharacterized protein RCC_03034 [Ramularia collo-cygni]CZT17202.1 uncharacterized protein RCC_03034 [Ramularia collo-cygni]
MPSSDYSSAIGGGLKLKGAGVDKKKKKKSKPKPPAENKSKEDGAGSAAENESSALQKALAEEEGEVEKPQESEVNTFGKTEAQRRHEERRKKRASLASQLYIAGHARLTIPQLDERLKREGVQTHKERVQQLNKYLSTLSEHNDMPRIGPG